MHSTLEVVLPYRETKLRIDATYHWQKTYDDLFLVCFTHLSMPRIIRFYNTAQPYYKGTEANTALSLGEVEQACLYAGELADMLIAVRDNDPAWQGGDPIKPPGGVGAS